MINKKIVSLALAATMIMSTAVNVFAYDDSESNTSSNSEMFESKPLVILMDFPDYKYTELDKRESGWSINNFIGAETTPEFYNELFFGDETYTTAAGERITANKFFKEVSGESYSMKGDVFGWYTAKHNIAYYGTTQEEAAILVKEGLDSLAKAKPNLNWSKYDVEDKWDLDQDGDFNEPDGIVDCVVLIHAGMGDEMNGGSVGHDAIWPFRIGFSWYADLKAQINDHRFVEKDENGYAKGAHTFKTKGSQTFMAEDFVIFEQDLPLDLFCHEYGHNLGLPDLYAGNGTGKPPVELWALMGGSYSGNPQGSQMVGYGGVLERWLQKDFEMRNRKANWQVSNDYTLAQLRDGLDVTLTGSQINNGELDAININLPEVDNEAIADFNAGSTYAYYTSAKDNMKTYLTSKENIDLTKATGDVNLTFDAWWTIDPGFDFVSVEVKKENETEYTAIRDKNAVTTQKLDDWLLGEDNKKLFQKENGDNWEAVWQADLKERNPGWGITGSSNDEFKKLEFDLNQYKGSKISLRFRFRTDGNTPEKGMFIDDIKITDGNDIIIEDDVENQENLKFACDENGFETSEGFLKPYQHSYTIEWRAIPKEQNVDKGLENPSLYKNNGESFEGKTSQFQYNPGLLVWYVNEKLNSDYPNQNIDEHIGEAYCGIMDAGRAPITEHWMKSESPYVSKDSSMQISDAAFSLRKGVDLFHTYDWNNGEDRFIVKDTDPTANPVYVDTDYTKFYDDPNDDYDKYNEKLAVLAHDYGLRIFVTNENEERNSANVHFGVEGGTPVIQENNSLAQVNIAGKSVIVTPKNPKNINGGSIELKLNDGYTVRRELTKNDDKTFIANFEDKNLEKAVVNYVILYETNGKATSVYNINQYKIFGVDFSKLDGKVEENKLDVNPIIKLNDEKVELADLIVGNTYDLSMEIIDINNKLTGKITRDSFTIPAEYNEIAEISENNKLIVKKLGIFKLNSTIEEQILDKWNTLASKENRITVDEVLPDLVKIVTNEKIEAAFKNVVDGKVILEVSSDEYFNAAAFEKIKELSKAKETTPDTTTPDATNPDATNPDATNPDATNPDATNP
ncbi:MAG: immune inhibitor A, partial [Oscillospiraceae bacterium]